MASNAGCRCASVAQPDIAGRLRMRVRLARSRARLRAALAESGAAYAVDGEMVDVELDGGAGTEAVYAVLSAALSSVERDEIRALILPHGGEPSVAEYFEIDTLERQLGVLKAGWLRRVLRDGALTSMLQPIVHAHAPDVPFGYEALLRVRVDGELRAADEAFSVARRAGLLPALDRAARESAILNAAPHLHGARLFVNFTPSSIYDPVSCLQATVALLERTGLSHAQIVFEVIESERIGDVEHLRKILRYYRDRGLAVALDDLGSGYASLQLLNELRPDFVKIDMELIRGVDRDPYKAAIAEKLIEAAHRIGLTIVAEGVETAGEFDWVRARGVQLVQGYYVARPALPPELPAVPNPPAPGELAPVDRMAFPRG
jgi:EAL domain-containing protein (putative c-di-GMP-specific phosphodiesterase class I)